MISGFFGVEDALFFEVELITSSGLNLPVDALFDTAFSYWIALEEQDIDGFGWVRLESQTMITAMGETDFDVYAGKVIFDGQEFEIPIHVGEDLPEPLLGRQWLKTRKLLVDMPGGILTLG
jgi:predicted aspartyl protease